MSFLCFLFSYYYFVDIDMSSSIITIYICNFICLHCDFASFPVVDWFCLFVDLWVLPFPLTDCSVFGNFVITLIFKQYISSLNKFSFDLVFFPISPPLCMFFFLNYCCWHVTWINICSMFGFGVSITRKTPKYHTDGKQIQNQLLKSQK